MKPREEKQQKENLKRKLAHCPGRRYTRTAKRLTPRKPKPIVRNRINTATESDQAS